MVSILLAAALSTLPVNVRGADRPPLSVRLRDPDAIHAAVKRAVGSTPPPAGRTDTALGADPYRSFANAVDEARVPSCLDPDALKHQPAKIGPVDIGGIYALPFLAAAIVRGKCN